MTMARIKSTTFHLQGEHSNHLPQVQTASKVASCTHDQDLFHIYPF